MSRYIIKLKDRSKFFFKNTWEESYANIYNTYQDAVVALKYLKIAGFNCEIILEKELNKTKGGEVI